MSPERGPPGWCTPRPATAGFRCGPGRGPGPSPDQVPDRGRPPLRWAGGDVHQLVAERPVGLLVHPFERQRVLEADPAGRGGLAEPDVAEEEHPALVDPV